MAWERRIQFPSLDVRLFRDPRFSASVGAVGLVFFAAMGTLFFIAFYLQLVRGYSPLQSRPAVHAVRGGPADLRTAQRGHGPPVRPEGGRAPVGLALVAVALAGFTTLGVRHADLGGSGATSSSRASAWPT